MSRWVRRSSLAARCWLVAALLLGSLALPASAFAAGTATVGEELNLRSGPGRGYRVVAVMPAGSSVTVMGDASEGWYPVTYNSTNGWAFGQYLAFGDGPAVSTSGARGAATVITNLLNVRSGPGFRYGVVAQLPYGTTVEVVGDREAMDGVEWQQIMTKAGQRGWAAGQYLQPGESAPAAAAAPATPAAPAPAAAGGSVIEIITAAANRYGQNPAAMIAIAKCESGLNPLAYNARSGASGLFQFMPGTWKTTPFASYSIFDAWASANAAAWMWQQGRRGEWVC